MTVRSAPWPSGTPAWVDLLVTDLGTIRHFYAALFGWTYDETASPDGWTYLQASVGGYRTAGLGDATPPPGSAPGAWTVYLATDDVDATVTLATEAGADVLLPATRAGDGGVFAVLRDPAGAVVGLWQAGTDVGAEVVEEPGALTWAETFSHDHTAARDFYATVFGVRYDDLSGPGFAYASFAADGRTVGGIGRIADGMGVSADPHWLVYFAVEDTDDAVRTALAHGGDVLREPWDSAFGRIALVTGPAGERFAVLAPLASEAAAGQGRVDGA